MRLPTLNDLARLPGVRQRASINALDYLLTGLGSCLAGFSSGMSIQQPVVAWFFVQWIVVGTIFSLVVRRLFPRSKWLVADGILYAAAAGGAIFYGRTLNGLLPGEAFPRELLAAGWLGWMLVFGSFLTWRDGTLLFQAVPAVALFGLVGCYDTFRDVVWLFFGYLVCLATLFARAHGREMLRQAAESGFAAAADTSGRRDAQARDDAFVERVKEGPWRWVAGPEWALASALAVVLLSLLGAPVIEQSVKTVAGGVRVPVSRVPLRNQTQQNSATQTPGESVPVGTGPNESLDSTPLFEIAGHRSYYWRTSTFDRWTGRGWRATWDRVVYPDGDIASAAAREMNTPGYDADFSIRRLVPTRVVPVVGQMVRWSPNSPVQLRPDDSYVALSEDIGQVLSGRSMTNETSPPEGVTGKAQRSLPDFLKETLSAEGVNAEVTRFAREAAGEDGTDVERAERVRRAISRTIVYNLRAPATPPGDDPVRYALFDSKQSYCDVYASAMVQGARTIGIPARYVQGYLADPRNVVGDRQVLLDKNYHAWAELYFQGRGWVVFDATDGAAEVPGSGRGDETEGEPLFGKDFLRRALDVGIVLVVLAGAGYALFLRRRPARPDAVVRDLERAYDPFSRELERIQRRRLDPSLSPAERVAAAASALGPMADAARALAARFDRAFFGPVPPTAADVAALRRDVAAWRKESRRSGHNR